MVPAEELCKSHAMGKSLFADANCFQDSGVLELLEDLFTVPLFSQTLIVGPDAADEVRRSGDHLLQEIHQRVAEVGGHRLLRPALRRQTSGVERPIRLLIN